MKNQPSPHIRRGISTATQEHIAVAQIRHLIQSLTLHCTIENGMVLSLGRAVDPTADALAAFDRLRKEIGEPALVIGCDCIGLRLEFEGSGLLDAMGGTMKRNQVFGFSTYGEQFDGLHMNQTFTGVAIGTGHALA